MTQLVHALVERLVQLPEPMQNQLAERFLKAVADAEEQPTPPARTRVAGLGQGTLIICDDFDEPLPEAFWLGDA